MGNTILKFIGPDLSSADSPKSTEIAVPSTKPYRHVHPQLPRPLRPASMLLYQQQELKKLRQEQKQLQQQIQQLQQHQQHLEQQLQQYQQQQQQREQEQQQELERQSQQHQLALQRERQQLRQQDIQRQLQRGLDIPDRRSRRVVFIPEAVRGPRQTGHPQSSAAVLPRGATERNRDNLVMVVYQDPPPNYSP